MDSKPGVFKGKKIITMALAALILIAIIVCIVIYVSKSKEVDAPYGPGGPATEKIDSVPVEPELQLNN